MLFIILLIITLSTYIQSHKDFRLKCEEIYQMSETDQELQNLFKDNFDTILNTNNHIKCIEILMRSGNYETLEFLLQILSTQKIKFTDQLKQITNSIEREMKELYNKYRFTDEDFQNVSPVIQWAQNLNNVFLQLKFSHRHDSPGCPEVKDLKIDITSKMLYVSSYCIQTDIPIKFELNLPFFVDINADESKHEEDSNGRYFFSFPKAKEGMYWDRLVPFDVEYPKNTRIWMDMYEKYKSEIEQFVNQDEEEEYQRLIEKLNKKKKKGRKKKVKFD